MRNSSTPTARSWRFPSEWNNHPSRAFLAAGDDGLGCADRGAVHQDRARHQRLGCAHQASAMTYPLVAKGIVPGIAHKSDLDLVELSIVDATDLESRVKALFDRMAALPADRDAGPVAVEIQEMTVGGAEFFIGMHSDPILGPIMSFGLGRNLPGSAAGRCIRRPAGVTGPGDRPARDAPGLASAARCAR